MIDSYAYVRIFYMSAYVSASYDPRLFHKYLGNLRELFGQMVHHPPGKKLLVRLCVQLDAPNTNGLMKTDTITMVQRNIRSLVNLWSLHWIWPVKNTLNVRYRWISVTTKLVVLLFVIKRWSACSDISFYTVWKKCRKQLRTKLHFRVVFLWSGYFNYSLDDLMPCITFGLLCFWSFRVFAPSFQLF